MNKTAIHPIIYVRGYAMTQTEIEETVADPYMGFNIGSCKTRQLWDGRIKKFFFESPLVRLMKEYDYDDVYDEGLDQVADDLARAPVVPYRSIIIYRYYEPSSQDLGTSEKPNMQRFAKGLSDLILRLRARIYAQGKDLSEQDRAKGKLPYEAFRVHLVAHSMGGLVCRAFLQNKNPKYGDDEARSLVDKLFTYGTPHNGIEMVGLGNVPSWLSLYGMNTFNRDEIAKHLDLKQPDRGKEGDVDMLTNFDSDRVFNLVGTDPDDYTVARGLSSFGAGPASDGLVRTKNAVTGAWKGKQWMPSPHAFVHRSHSGYFGIVNSEEGYQNLIRFLYGDVRADGFLDVDILTLPPDVQKEYDKGKTIRASYQFEVVVSVRGKQWQLHRRTANENSAIFRPFDDLFPKLRGKRQPDRSESPHLFSVFLDRDQRVDKERPSLAFSVDLCVKVPEYEIDGLLFFKNHFEGGYLFRDMIILEATPPQDDKSGWRIEYRFVNKPEAGSQVAEIVKNKEQGLTFEIPIVQPKPPGIKATLRVATSLWNWWQYK
jgi:hypothetical protein